MIKTRLDAPFLRFQFTWENNGVKMSQEIFLKIATLNFYTDNYFVTMNKAYKGHIFGFHV